MVKFIYILLALVLAALTFTSYPEGATCLVVIGLLCAPVLYAINQTKHAEYLNFVFALALLLRLSLGLIIHFFDLRLSFGPDAINYHGIALTLIDIWYGIPVPDSVYTELAYYGQGMGRGMYYWVAVVYLVFGTGILISQTVCGVIGAATVPLVFYCSMQIFRNVRVAKYASFGVAVFPAFVIWSSQLLKDGLVVFLLMVTMIIVMKLQEKFSLPMVAVLILSMTGILFLRSYVFIMVAVATVGTFIVGMSTNSRSILQRIVILAILGVGLTYLGVIQDSMQTAEQFSNLQTLQNSRNDLATRSNSGLAEDADISTAQGALWQLPFGIIFLLFAPFPWQAKSFVQYAVLAEVFVWWAMVPIMFYGISYTIKNNLRRALPILIFTLLLSLTYAITQGNAGMIYRQRTQVQVFFFIFVAVGVVIKKEELENKKLLRQMQKRSAVRGMNPPVRI